MKKVAACLACLGLILAVSGVAQAALVTFQFDPNSLLDEFPANSTGPKATQENAREVIQSITPAGGRYGTFSESSSQPGDYNTYRNWLGSLGAGEGIASFNMWMSDHSPAAQAWGETLVMAPKSATSATADMGNGWYAQVIDNYWLTDGYMIVRWYTTNPDNYLRPGGTDIGDFSFTVDVKVDNDGNGWDADDPDAVVGDTYRAWFGSQNGQESDPDKTGAIFFNDSWELSPGVQGFASVGYSEGEVPYGTAWAGALNLTAEAVVPEASSVLVWVLLAGLAVFIRRAR